MKLISLSQGLFAQVDDEDFDLINQFKWQGYKHGNTFYAQRSFRISSNKRKTIQMHNFILNVKNIDHIDGNGLNNQKHNLRICNQAQNNRNAKKVAKASSVYKGVSWKQDLQKWNARITFNRKTYHLGYYDSEFNAAMAYDLKAKELFGEFAKTNFNI